MHKDDEMTPNERMNAFSKGLAMDRIPVMPFLSVIGGAIAGMSLRQMRQSGADEARMQIAAYEKLGHDIFTVDYGLHGIGVALGSKTNDPENAVPAVMEFAFTDLSKIDQMDIDKVTSANDKDLRNHLEATEILLNTYGHECGVDISISGPFTAAASICSTGYLLRAMRKEPDKLHQLLKFTTDALKSVCKEFAAYNISFTLCDPIASSTVIRPAQYRDVYSRTCGIYS